MKNIFNNNLSDLEEYFLGKNEKKFKALQVFEWLYQKRVFNANEFSNLKKEIREMLEEDFSFDMPKIIKIEEDQDTKKYLFELMDGEKIEAVLMIHNYGNSVCISTQVGCNMGCRFCESGRLKKVRNLETHEMVCQILLIEELIKDRIASVVLMGIGEPLDNYDNVIKFIEIINHPKGIQIGARHITISTCGLIPKIKELMDFPLQVNLALSLHAASDEKRNELMPVNKMYKLADVLQIIRAYIAHTNRRVTMEYVMLNMVNDTKEDALALALLLRGMNVYVNLIPYNETNHIEFTKSSKERVLAFYDILKKEKINVTIRREFGSKISAACGQLRSKEVDK